MAADDAVLVTQKVGPHPRIVCHPQRVSPWALPFRHQCKPQQQPLGQYLVERAGLT